uniref:Megakaryocyte and platelet inhibitory receptor G6b n=1 Tax=Equus asinus TaxID=9793 RepID=A0A9L0K138_EQUAS
MALVLQLLPLLLSGTQGDPVVSLDGRPGDRVNLSCGRVSHPARWAWAPSFPACKGLSKGRRPILWASLSGTPTVSPVQPFAGRLRVLDSGIRRLELLLSAGDSGSFYCKGRDGNESRTALHVLGDGADCRAPGPTGTQAPPGSVYPQLLIPLLPLLGAGLVLGLGALGVVWWRCRRCPLTRLDHYPDLVRLRRLHLPSPTLICPTPQFLSLSLCWEQTSWSSLSPSALCPPTWPHW